MNRYWEVAKGVALALILLLGIAVLLEVGQAGIEELGVTNFGSVHLSDAGATATPVLLANQSGTGAIAVFQDALTPVASFYDGGNADIAGTLQYGANDLYAVGYASSGQQLVYGTDQITGTATAAHGLTTVTFCACTLGEDPTSGAGDGAMCTVAISANVCPLKVWQDDFVTAATETDVDVHWLVVGAP